MIRGNLSKDYEYKDSKRIDYMKVIIHIVCYILCILLLKYLCDTGNIVAAWIVLFLPCIFTSISLVSFISLIKKALN